MCSDKKYILFPLILKIVGSIVREKKSRIVVYFIVTEIKSVAEKDLRSQLQKVLKKIAILAFLLN